MRDEGSNARRARDANCTNRCCTSSSCSRYPVESIDSVESNDPDVSSRCSKSRYNAAANASPPEKRPTGVDASVKGNSLPSAGGATSAVDHRPHETLTSDPKSRRRRPTADLAKRLSNNCTPRRRSTSSRRRSPQCEVCSPYRAVRMNTRAKFGWRGQAGVRRLNSLADASQRPLNSAGPQTTCPGEQRPVPKPHHA